MSSIINGISLEKMTHNGHKVKKWFHNGVNVWNYIVDTAITLIVSSKNSAGALIWPYELNAKIYENIDMSLYKGIQVYVDAADIDCNFSNNGCYLRVTACNDGNFDNNLGFVQIASCYNNGSGTTNTSEKGKTVNFEFTTDNGFTDLYVLGMGGGTSDGGSWSLSNAILLAR